MAEIGYWKKLKEKDPIKYKQLRDKWNAWQREYNKEHRDKIKAKEYNRKAYEKLKSDPVRYAEHKRKIKEYYHKRWNDPEFRKKMYEYQRNYMQKLKKENPEKYFELTRHSFIQDYKTGLKCKGCGKGIKTNCAGHLGKRPIVCPFCGNSYPRRDLEKVKIPRIIFGEKGEKTEVAIEKPKVEITEQTLKNLKNFSRLTEKNTDESVYREVGDET
jgi:hypothetical protein